MSREDQRLTFPVMLKAHIIFYICLISVLPYAAQTEAASFDCSKASTPRDRLICKTPALSELDSQLGRIYETRRALLSSDGRELLKTSQVSWLRFVYTVCAVTGNAKIADGDRAAACIQGHYYDRLTQLNEVGRRFGPFLLNRVDLYSAKPAPDESGEIAGFYTRHIAYLQIDSATTAPAIEWNHRQKLSINEAGFSDSNDDGESDSDDESSYSLNFVNDRVLSLSKLRSSYTHGAPHGMSGTKVETIVLPEFRALTAEDIFGTNTHALPALLTLFRKAYLAEGWPSAGSIAMEMQRVVDKVVIDPKRWQLTEEGLQVPFSPYEVGCYVCSPPPVTVPWSDLKPLLGANAVVP